MKISKIVFLIFLMIFYGSLGLSLPRFSSATNLKCQNCHIDPDGGGMRNYYGAAMWGRQTLPMHIWESDSTVGEFSTKLSDVVSIGMDMRTLLTYQQPRDYLSFFQMQGDIYFSARLSQSVLLSVTKPLEHDFEIFGMANILPANGYVKVGRFTPAYGTRIDDHTAYIRTKTVFPFYRRADTGVEAGITPGLFTWNVGVYNGESGADPSNGWVRLVTTRAETFFQVNKINFSLGGSAWYNNGQAGILTMYGGFAGVGLYDATLHAEIDVKKDKSLLGATELISYLELNYLIMEGIDLKFMYDFYDPDIDFKTGTATRYSIGAEFFPLPGTEVRPMYRFSDVTYGTPQKNEFDLLVHFFL